MKIPTQHTIILARHGQTNFNVEGKIQDPIKPHLTEVGIQQARNLAKKISQLDLKFDVVICAKTTRNIQTLKEVYPNYNQIGHVKIDPRLQERYHRDLVGKNKEDIESDVGEKLKDRLSWHLYFEGTDKSKLTEKAYPNDETLISVKERLTSLIEDLKDKSTVLLLGSQITNQYILEYLQYGTIGKQRPRLPNGRAIDFQENGELRIITTDENMRVQNYSSINY